MAFDFKIGDLKLGGGKPKDKPAESAAAPMTAVEEAWDLARTVFYAVAIALVLRIVIFQPFNIPSGSMKPTLEVGDFLFVSKPTYGYSRASLIYPFTRMDMHGRILAGNGPKRGEIVVFKARKDGNKDYIKRIIGMPGDRIDMIDGRLHINGEPVQKESLGMVETDCGYYHRSQAVMYRETLPNGVSYLVQECDGDEGDRDDVGPYLVPAGHYFMMGDNRDQSQDSRTPQVLYVPAEDIVGRAERIFFSVDGKDTALWEIWKWPFAIRYGRIFDPVR
ncbi:MAG TPA: signal peptidase I [Parvularculaceae bacterium]|nr:signal peptidase I [Parvularculaceae bacterium]